jgi:hypothetical protein
MDMTRVIDKWFEKHHSLTLQNYEMLKEMAHLFIDEIEPTAKVVRVEEELPEVEKEHGWGEYSKGKLLRYNGNVAIYSNPLEDLREEYKKGNPDPIRVLQRYYKVTNPNTVKKYIWGYRKALGITMPKVSRLSRSELGDVVHQINHNKVFSNVLDDFREALLHGRSLKKVIRKYYPIHKKSTIKTYVALYKRYIKEIEKRNIVKHTRRGFNLRQPPADNYAYNDAYQTYILQDEVKKINNALNRVEYGYRSSAKQISEVTNMPKHRVRAVLNQLIFENKVGYTSMDRTPIYFLK